MLSGRGEWRFGMALLAVCLVCGQPVHAGDRRMTNGSLLVPACARGECRSGAGARVQGALLQTAALSVALGPGGSRMGNLRLRDQPRRSRARLPSWYRRAQTAEVRGQAAPVAQVRSAPVQPSVRTRVRERVVAGANERSQGAELERQGRAAASVSTDARPGRQRAAALPRPEVRAARHRRLIQESLEAMVSEMDWEAQERELRDVPAAQMSSPEQTSLVNHNFSSTIRDNPSGNYRLAESVLLNSTTDLPLSNETHPFRGTLKGTVDTSLRIDLNESAGRNLHVFGGLANASVDLSVENSRLINNNGGVALFGGSTDNSTLTLQVSDSALEAQGGSHAALVEKLGDNNEITLRMRDSNITVSGSSASGEPLVAGPVAQTLGRNNSLHVYNSSGNRVMAQGEGQQAPVVASLGWGHLDFRRCSRAHVPGGCPVDFASPDDWLDQSDLADNHVRAKVAGQGERAHASLAGSYGQKDWHGVHRLEQKRVTGNRIEALIPASGAGLGLASLGLVHDLKNISYPDSNPPCPPCVHINTNNGAEFQIRQQACGNNTVTGSVRDTVAVDRPVASLSVTTDHSLSVTADHSHNPTDHSPAPMGTDFAVNNRLWVVQKNLSENQLVVAGEGAGGNSSKALVGSFESRTGESARGNCPALPRDDLPYVALFLFSGGDRRLPISAENDAVLEYPSHAKCDHDSLIDEAAYSFGDNVTGLDHDCLRDPDKCESSDFGRVGRVRVIVSSTHRDGWEQVHKAFCETVPRLFDGKDRHAENICECSASGSCPHGADTSCHNPGEVFHSLVPATGSDNMWLLVSRQTWPAGSEGNHSSTDLFRVESFHSPVRAGGLPHVQHASTGDWLYNGTRVVPEAGGRVMAHASSRELHHLYQTGADPEPLQLTWIAFPLPAPHLRSFNGVPFLEGGSRILPAGTQLMLLSTRDGHFELLGEVNVWTRNSTHDATVDVERWTSPGVEPQGIHQKRSYVLAQEREPPPLALALALSPSIHTHWLYSLHRRDGVNAEDSAGPQEFQIRRWDISQNNATLDTSWEVKCLQAEVDPLAPGRLIVSDNGA
ncbi:MAG: hypothetical protein OXC07_08535, partial [Kistimonas sp.]|nr:hypothetical protein [Kistimonas sp.]